METHETVLPITPGQVKELLAALVQAVPLDMSSETAQAWIGRKGVLSDILRRGPSLVCQTHSTSISFLLRDWQSFYKKFFGLDLDFTGVRIANKRPGFDRLIVVAQDLTPNKVYEASERHGIKCWRYTNDLDASVTHNDRVPTEHYAIWVRDRQESDEELKNLSTNDLQKKNIKGITLPERMIFGLKYWDETKKHLDVDNITLCAGSRPRGGRVPRVNWYRRRSEVYVSACDPGHSCGRLRSREVVSF